MKQNFPVHRLLKIHLAIASSGYLFWSGQALAQNLTPSYSAEAMLSLPTWLFWLFTVLIILAVIISTTYIGKLRSALTDTKSVLARSAAEWSYAMDFLEDPMYLVDLNDRLVRANRAFYHQIGKTPEEALGRDVRSLIHLKPETTPCPACAARLERRDAFFTKEADDPTNPTGRPIEVTIRVVKNDNGEPIGIFQGLRDLSHLRQTEQALRESQQRLANAQRIAHVGNWDWDINKDELICSAELCNIFDLSKVDGPITMNTLIHCLPLTEQATFRAALEQAVESGEAFRLDQQLELTGGRHRYIHQEARINLGRDAKPISLSGRSRTTAGSSTAW